MKKIDKSVLLFSKDDHWCEKAYEYLRDRFHFVYHIAGNWGDPLPKYIDNILDQGVDYIISYLCPWILSKDILDKAKEHAINFHPAPPKYAGIGGYNYCIMNNDEDYGVMCHEMAEKVDSGKIYKVVYFSMDDDATVKSLKEESMCMLFGLFKDIMIDIEKDGKIGEYFKIWGDWNPKTYTRKMFQEACEIDLCTEDKLRIKKHVRAFYFENARDFPFVKIDGMKYKITPIREE